MKIIAETFKNIFIGEFNSFDKPSIHLSNLSPHQIQQADRVYVLNESIATVTIYKNRSGSCGEINWENFTQKELYKDFDKEFKILHLRKKFKSYYYENC